MPSPDFTKLPAPVIEPLYVVSPACDNSKPSAPTSNTPVPEPVKPVPIVNVSAVNDVNRPLSSTPDCVVRSAYIDSEPPSATANEPTVSSLRASNTAVSPTVTATVSANVPRPAAVTNVPPVTSKPPVKVCAPLTVNAPAPDFSTTPAPSMMPANNESPD